MKANPASFVHRRDWRISPRKVTSFAATVCLCAVLGAGLPVIVFQETDGFEHWTFEAQRRQAVREGRMQAPSVALGDGVSMPWVPWSVRPASDSVYIVDFIYTRCPGLCEGLGGQFRLMQRELQRQHGDGPVSLLSISFDPTHDSPEQLSAYAQRHGADPALWHVTRLADAEATKELLEQLGIVAVEDGSGGFVHNSALHVIDRDGQVRGVYDYGSWNAALEGALRVAREHREEGHASRGVSR